MNENLIANTQSKPQGKLVIAILSLLIIFMVVFPKGGIKIGSVPLTIGYVIYAILLFLLVTIKMARPIRISSLYYVQFICMLPFFSLVLIGFLLSMSQAGSVYEFIALVNFIVIPFSLVFLLKREMHLIDRGWLYRKVSIAAVITAFYGIFLFLWFIKFNSYIEIPYLTVNKDDVDNILGKSNLRFDGVSKLISTYNNGNIYAICMLMLLPFVLNYLDGRLWKIVFVIAICLTLSRTAWAGLIFYFLFSRFYLSKLKFIKVMQIAFLGFFLAVVFYFLAYFLGYAEFVFDSSLGGRVEGFELFEFRFFPSGVFAEISENSYVTIMNIYGLFGLLSFLLFMMSPFIAVRLNAFVRGGRYVWTDSSVKERFCISLGMANYIFISLADGALMLIPVLFIYFSLVSLYLVLHSRAFVHFGRGI